MTTYLPREVVGLDDTAYPRSSTKVWAQASARLPASRIPPTKLAVASEWRIAFTPSVGAAKCLN